MISFEEGNIHHGHLVETLRHSLSLSLSDGARGKILPVVRIVVADFGDSASLALRSWSIVHGGNRPRLCYHVRT